MKWITLGVFFLVSPLAASTYYISTSTGLDSNVCSQASPCNTVLKLKSVMIPGDTGYFMDGTYSISSDTFNDTNLGTGSLTTNTWFISEHDGGAIISANVSMRDSSTPLQTNLIFQGFLFTSTVQKNIYGYGLKFFNCGFKNGPAADNSVNTAVGGNNNGSNLTRYALFQDCWWFGPGGRYNLLVFNSENIVLRRTVLRHEGGYTYDGSDPEAAFALYNSSAVEVQDMVLVGNTTNYTAGWTQAFYYIHNPSAVPDHVSNGNAIRGLAVLGATNICIRADAVTSSNNIWQDVVAAECQNGGISFGSNNNTTVSLNRFGTIRINKTQSGDFQGGMGYFGTGGSVTATNTIVAGNVGSDYNGVTPTFFDTFGNGSNLGSGTGRQTFNPQTNGWLYPVRIESGSNLATNGTGGQLGPNITTEIGTSSTSWGDPGYNTDTGLALWPWPNQARIKTDFDTTAPGWNWSATTQTLTDFTWTFFGSSCPASVCGTVVASTPAAPTSISTTAVSASSINYSYVASTDTDTTGYKVDLSTDNFSTFSAGYNNTDLGNVTSSSFTGLTASTVYTFRLRSYNATNTGANSLTQVGTTSAPVVSPSRSITVGPSVIFGASVTLK